jgi:hypothetical protein
MVFEIFIDTSGLIIHKRVKRVKNMKEIEKSKNVKMNLTIPPEFYQVLQQNAKSDYVKVATWTKQFLMKNLEGDKKDEKCLTKNEATMGN